MHGQFVADSALRYSLNTRMTHEAAYNRYRHELENIGIDSVSAFRRIIHSTQSLESAQCRKHLEEQRDGTKLPATNSFLRHRSLFCENRRSDKESARRV